MSYERFLSACWQSVSISHIKNTMFQFGAFIQMAWKLDFSQNWSNTISAFRGHIFRCFWACRPFRLHHALVRKGILPFKKASVIENGKPPSRILWSSWPRECESAYDLCQRIHVCFVFGVARVWSRWSRLQSRGFMDWMSHCLQWRLRWCFASWWLPMNFDSIGSTKYKSRDGNTTCAHLELQSRGWKKKAVAWDEISALMAC